MSNFLAEFFVSLYFDVYKILTSRLATLRVLQTLSGTVISETEYRFLVYLCEVKIEACRYIKFHPSDYPVTSPDPLEL
jgi:hypothetical protein